MSLNIKLRSPEVSEMYTQWEAKATAFDREYYEYNKPDEHEVLWEGELAGYAMREATDLLKTVLKNEDEAYPVNSLPDYLMFHLKGIPPDEHALIDFLCSYLAACLKYPNAIIETNY